MLISGGDILQKHIHTHTHCDVSFKAIPALFSACERFGKVKCLTDPLEDFGNGGVDLEVKLLPLLCHQRLQGFVVVECDERSLSLLWWERLDL